MRVEDVSFVVVAKDEAYAIRLCLDSILRLDLVNCDVICVDSASADETLSIMRGYEERYDSVRVIMAPQCRNSAEARNIGKDQTSKRWVCFVDGDIELYPTFLHAALGELECGGADAVTGGLDEVTYSDSSGQRIDEIRVRHRYPQRVSLMSCGGTYITKRCMLDVIGDYDVRFDRSQDIDYTLRLSSVARLIGLPMSMGLHHTKEYRARPWAHVVNGYVLCQGMLARKHHGRHGFYREWIRSRKSYLGGLMLVCAVLGSAAIFVIDSRYGWLLLSSAIATATAVGVLAVRTQLSTSAAIALYVVSPVLIVIGFIIEPYIRDPARGPTHTTPAASDARTE